MDSETRSSMDMSHFYQHVDVLQVSRPRKLPSNRRSGKATRYRPYYNPGPKYKVQRNNRLENELAGGRRGPLAYFEEREFGVALAALDNAASEEAYVASMNSLIIRYAILRQRQLGPAYRTFPLIQ